MKIVEVRAVPIVLRPNPKTPPRVPKIADADQWVSPMQRYDEFSRGAWSPNGAWSRTACVVTAEDGTWGLGLTLFSGPVVRLIQDHLSSLVVGQNPMAVDKIWDMLQRSASPYGRGGIASYAISALDTALWDLKGKLLRRPVYELLGGPQKEQIFCYASNTDISYGAEASIAWFLELGFKAVKVFLRHGPEDGISGLRRNEELVAHTREQVGDDVELMVDAWMSLNSEYAVRLAEALRPYRIKWLEDYLLPEDMESYFRVRQRLPGQTLASGEHWSTIHPFATAAAHGLVDIFQPDILWSGGISAVVRICHLAEAHGQTVITHAGMNYPYGQHLALAMPAVIWGERSEGVSPPGVPLEEMVTLPGTVPIRDGTVRPTDAPGFGLEVTKDWLEAAAG